MFHKNVVNSLRSVSPQQVPESPQITAQTPASPVRLALVPPCGGVVSKKNSLLLDLVAIAAHRLFLVLRRGGRSGSCSGPARQVYDQGPHGIELGHQRLHHQRGPARRQRSHGILIPSLVPASLILNPHNALGLPSERPVTAHFALVLPSESRNFPPGKATRTALESDNI